MALSTVAGYSRLQIAKQARNWTETRHSRADSGINLTKRLGAVRCSGVRILGALKLRSLFPICAALLLVGGCPKRQTGWRLVYVTAPPPKLQSQASTSAEVLTIEAPANEEPEALPPESPATNLEPAPKRPPRRRHTIRPDASSEAEAGDDAEPASSAGVPALQPRQDSQRLAALRRDLTASQENTRRRLAQLDHAQLGQGDRRTLDDAKAFLSQSEHEFERGEILRAMNLARKAALLVSAIEQSH